MSTYCDELGTILQRKGAITRWLDGLIAGA